MQISVMWEQHSLCGKAHILTYKKKLMWQSTNGTVIRDLKKQNCLHKWVK